MAQLAIASMIMSGLSTYAQMEGLRAEGNMALQAGRADQAAALREGEQLRAQGKAEVATAQRRMIERRRQKELAQSRTLAVAGAQGSSTSDINVQDAFWEIEREGEFNAVSALYEGISRKTALENQANAAEYRGEIALWQGQSTKAMKKSQAQAALISGIGDIASQGATAADTYGWGS